jgi:hypothetical protein
MFVPKKKKIDFNNCVVNLDSNSLGVWSVPSPWLNIVQTKVNNVNCIFNNYSVSGQSTSDMIDDAVTQVDGGFIYGKSNVLFVMEVGNDLYTNDSPNLAVATEKFKRYCLERRAKGFIVIVMTCYDRQYTLGQSATLRRDLLNFNAWLRLNWAGFANSIVDCWQDPIFRDASNASIFSDGVHPSANIVNQTIAELAYQELLKI